MRCSLTAFTCQALKKLRERSLRFKISLLILYGLHKDQIETQISSWGYRSVVEPLPRMAKALGLIPSSLENKTKTKTEIESWVRVWGFSS